MTETEKTNPILQKLIQQADWKAIGRRISGYRLIQGWTPKQFVAKLDGVTVNTLRQIEAGKTQKSLNGLWEIVRSQQISINWLFCGKGKYDSQDPAKLLPTTILQTRGAGIRRSKERKEAEEGEFTGDAFEFVMAIDRYKSCNNKSFVTWTEAFELLIQLGYRKTASPTINPH